MNFLYSLLEIIFLPLSFLLRVIGYSAFVIIDSLEFGWKEAWLLQQEAAEKIKNKGK